MTEPANHLEAIEVYSKGRRQELERMLFPCHPNFPVGEAAYFLGTLDLNTHILYSPLASFSSPVMVSRFKSIIKSKSDQLLDVVRNAFPKDSPGTKLILDICSTLRAQEPRTKDLILLQVSGDFRSVKHAFQWSSHGFVEAHHQVSALVKSTPELTGENTSILSAFRQAFGCEGDSFLLVRYGDSLPDETATRGLDLYQVGFLLWVNEFDLKSEAHRSVIEKLDFVTRTSHFSTLNLFYERERYFQKAVRQAEGGQMLKIGPRDDIDKQANILARLHQNKRLFVPQLGDRNDNSAYPIGDYSKPLSSWFTMTRLTLDSFLDILTSTSRFEDFEVESLTRACFSHLRQTYWKESIKEDSAGVPAHLSIAFALALQRAKDAVERLDLGKRAIDQGKPVNLRWGADIFEKKEIERFDAIVNCLLSDSCFHIDLAWYGTPGSLSCRSGLKLLEELDPKLRAITERKASCIRLKDDGRLHGDPHFANFLVDASIPEDPLIFSIDQVDVDYRDKQKQLTDLCGEAISRGVLEREVDSLRDDIAYDVAKMMLSSSCGYGLAYRSAFDIKSQQKEGHTDQILMSQRGAQVRRLSDVGGISASKLIKLDTPVPKDSLRYHRIAAGVIIRQYLSFLRDNLGAEYTVLAENCALLRLWFFTVRHGFSIAEILFPQDIERSLAMFLLVTRFMNIGFTEVARTLTNLEAPSSLRDVFTLVYDESKSELKSLTTSSGEAVAV